jgi:hypothetical protein
VSNLIGELYAEAGLPDGVFNVVHGDREAVDALRAPRADPALVVTVAAALDDPPEGGSARERVVNPPRAPRACA